MKPFVDRLGDEAEVRQSGVVYGQVAWILRFEGLLLFTVSCVAYQSTGTPWWIFALAFLVPDIGMVGYLGGPRLGAWTYNLLHTTVLPILFGLVWYFTRIGMGYPYLAIWMAHIGFDRFVGYGLKYPSAFGFTHLAMLGKDKH